MSFDPIDHVDEIVTIHGTALTARGGAIVSLEDGSPIYVAGLSAWSDVLDGETVEVTGRLRRRPSRLPEVPPGEPHAHGVGETFALENASWTPAA